MTESDDVIRSTELELQADDIKKWSGRHMIDRKDIGALVCAELGKLPEPRKIVIDGTEQYIFTTAQYKELIGKCAVAAFAAYKKYDPREKC